VSVAELKPHPRGRGGWGSSWNQRPDAHEGQRLNPGQRVSHDEIKARWATESLLLSLAWQRGPSPPWKPRP